MDQQKRPRSRVKKVVNEGKGVEKRGEGLGTGPVNNAGNYEERRTQQDARPRTASAPVQRPSAGTQAGGRPAQPNPFGSSSGQDPMRNDERTQRPQSGGFYAAPGNRPSESGGRPYNHAVKQNGTGGQRASGSGMGGGKLLIVVIALVVLFGGGHVSGLFGGTDEPVTDLNQIVSGQQIQTQTSTNLETGNGDSGLSDLLSALLGSSGSSVYDFTGSAGSLLSGSGSGNTVTQVSTSSGGTGTVSGNDSASPDESVSSEAREKYTRILGNNQDIVTILVYLCGTDLESQQGMATSDLKEMISASFGDNINLIVYTGGCSRWRNNVISTTSNQIYQIRDGGLYCLESNMGNASMVSPDTLASFIQYGTEKFPANRNCLILWDHGGGSVSGYGYDEKVGHGQSMTLAGIHNALKKADVKFDFIGFDACLMATVENGLMLSQYADYMIASEETEPGVGWYYTNWLTNLGKDTGLPTVRIGKCIADDFVEVCNRQCRGQATTLSVVDLAELQATVPAELKQFSIDTNELIQNKEYKTVSSARSRTREFAQSSRIDQIDLVDFANNLGTEEGKSLAKALQGTVKYNRTGGGISHAYGLSIYFPYQRANKVSQMVSTYQAIGMDEEYTRVIQEFASLEVSGQVSAGTSLTGYGTGTNASSGLLNSLLGQSGGYTPSYSAGGLSELLGGLYGGSGATGSILDLFAGRSMTAENAASYIADNHFDSSLLVWNDGQITLPDTQWDLVFSLVKNVFYDDGNGFIDLGCDAEFDLSGNTLTDNFDGTWLSIDRQPVAYYYLCDTEDGGQYGYVPALLNDVRVNLLLYFDSEGEAGIIGAGHVYTDDESGTQAKTMISVGNGDRIQFLCDYFDYDGIYRDSYLLGEPIVLGSTVEIANTPVGTNCSVTYRFTDLYQQHYWTPALR